MTFSTLENIIFMRQCPISLLQGLPGPRLGIWSNHQNVLVQFAKFPRIISAEIEEEELFIGSGRWRSFDQRHVVAIGLIEFVPTIEVQAFRLAPPLPPEIVATIFRRLSDRKTNVMQLAGPGQAGMKACRSLKERPMSKLETDDLRIHFDEHGSAHGDPILLLHGWPDDASTWDGVIAQLPPDRFRLVVPMLRGFGETVFKRDDAPRTANSAILAMDAIALMDGLGIDRFSVVGHDWGSNIAEGLAIGWPDRVARIALLSSMPRMGGMTMPPFRQAQRY